MSESAAAAAPTNSLVPSSVASASSSTGAAAPLAEPSNQTKKHRARQRRRHQTKKKEQELVGQSTMAALDGEEEEKSAVEAEKGKNKNKKRQKNKQRNDVRREAGGRYKGKFPWRRHIPGGSVDPITLESLFRLTYPPFALVAEEPYEAVPEWPVRENKQTPKEKEETEQERQRRIMQEQWGDKAADLNDDKKPAAKVQRHYHLYDGRALAYYMVSQLQFIDPLNRRDLTRPELVNLDQYLTRHGFAPPSVVAAYDAKGITLSSAGAQATTAAGRAAILQQTAQGLLAALFASPTTTTANRPSLTTSNNNRSASTGDGGNNHRRGNNNNENNLASLYQAQQQQQQPSGGTYEADFAAGGAAAAAAGVYGEAGWMVLDDDENPGLRSNAPEFVPGQPYYRQQQEEEYPALPSSRPQPPQRQPAQPQEQFPSLGAPPGITPTPTKKPPSAATSHQPAPARKSKTLAAISSAVKKTDPEELQRQWEAREAALRKAQLSNMTFGSNPVAMLTAASNEIPSSIVTLSAPDESALDAQVERNRALAQALGVQPSTMRSTTAAPSLFSGWARPVNDDAFGSELRTTQYPDALILQARERMTLVLKLEKKWKAWLQDDTAASLPLQPMDRPTRSFCHEYSDYWKLHTESFDAEPKRYIHCVKLLDTAAPTPLLSDAARHWRGPTPAPLPTAPAASFSDHHSSPLHQSATGQTTTVATPRDLPASPKKPPLPLKPRRSSGDAALSTSMMSGVTIGGAPTRTMIEPSGGGTGRFDVLDTRERPKLQLQKRTLPLEMPPPPASTAMQDGDVALQKLRLKQEQRALKQQQDLERKQRALEAAFADDDDAGDGGFHAWGEEQTPLFVGEDE